MAKIFSFFKRENLDMTSGNLFTKIILFALPMMLTTAMQLLYVTIDLMTVHYGDSAESMGAIASNNALINLIVVVFTGVSVGSNVILSEAKGAGNQLKAEKVINSSLLFALATGIFVGLLGFFVSDELLVAMGTEVHYLEKATLYLKIYFCGIPFLMMYNYAAQLLRGQGDARSPFFALMISGIINVGFDCLFVFPLKMGVAGVALATIIAEAISAFICLFVLFRGKHNYASASFKKMKMDWGVLSEILRIGLPAGLQGFFFSLPNVFIQASLYTIDPGNVNLENGVTASGNIEGYFFAFTDSIATATMTFIASNLGAKKLDNIKKCAWYGFIWGAIMCALIALLITFTYRPLLSLFVTTEESIEAGWQRLWIMAYFYILDYTMALTAAILRGTKRSVYPMITILICCTILRIVFVETIFKLEQFHTVFWLYFLFPISWILATIINIIGMAYFMPKDFKKIKRDLEAV